jgi:DNA-binding SARP family transcriptional activator
MLQIRLFGTGKASYANRPLPGFPNQQPHLLLCYLLLNRCQLHPREHLAAIFWGEYPTRTSRKNLRNALWRVRQMLQSIGAPAAEYLLIQEDSVSFSPSSPYSLDVEDFEAAMLPYQGLSGRELGLEEAARLEEAVRLYTGDLLTGIYQDWCLYERERLNLLHLNTLSKLMVFHEFNGTYEQGLDYGRRILAHDNTRERVHRRIMRLYWQSGNRGAALAQYQLCAQILYETLGISPLEETTRLYQQMKYGQFNPGIWANYQMTQPPVRAGREESVPLLAEQTLQRIRQLQASVEQISSELQQIERQLVRVLAGAWDLHTSSFHEDSDDA